MFLLCPVGLNLRASCSKHKHFMTPPGHFQEIAFMLMEHHPGAPVVSLIKYQGGTKLPVSSH